MRNDQRFLRLAVLCLLIQATLANNKNNTNVLEFLEPVCFWTYCAGKFINGQLTCDDSGDEIYATYTPRSHNGDGCKWDSHRVECCKVCKWGNSCHEIEYGGDKACKEDYGNGWKYSGHLHPSACKDAVLPGEQFRCCKLKKY